MQDLWSGYGKIVRCSLQYDDNAVDAEPGSVIVKQIQPPAKPSHPRGWNTDASAQRKLHSYRVEEIWYRLYAESARGVCEMPRLMASHASVEQTWLILEDLDIAYPARYTQLGVEACLPCLRWLARFHAYHLQSSGEGLWPIGTYWHLQTRLDEFEAMAPGPLKEAAHALDSKLENCQFKTLVHGDAKVANVCFSQNGREVAMLDFQYVGRGCGIRDVVYFLGSALTETQCEQNSDRLLTAYFAELLAHSPAALLHDLESEWRGLYAIAWADFHRFLAGWMPEHQKINRYTRAMTNMALAQL